MITDVTRVLIEHLSIILEFLYQENFVYMDDYRFVSYWLTRKKKFLF